MYSICKAGFALMGGGTLGYTHQGAAKREKNFAGAAGVSRRHHAPDDYVDRGRQIHGVPRARVQDRAIFRAND